MLRGPRHSLVTLRSWLVAPKSPRGVVFCRWPQASPRSWHWMLELLTLLMGKDSWSSFTFCVPSKVPLWGH